MSRRIWFSALAMAGGSFCLISAVKVTVLYDNTIHTPGTRADWGFSCLIESSGHTLLFDTGTLPYILADNAKKAGVDLGAIPQVVISHGHRDHFGGLPAVLRVASRGIRVYIPPNLPKAMRQKITAAGGTAVVPQNPLTLEGGMMTTGFLGDGIPEQGLILMTGKQNVLITGCSHPGIVNMVRQARTIIKANVDVVLGGFHLAGHSQKAVADIIRQFRLLGVRRTGPTHCTGEAAIDAFRKAYGKNFIAMGVGRVLELE